MKNLVIRLGALTLIATLASIILFAVGYPVAGAIIGTMTLFFWLALLVVSVVAVTTWWSASLMERGAELALRSQESDDQRDIAMMRTLGILARGWQQQQRPAPPLLSQQQGEWLPELAEFSVVDGESKEVTHD